MDDREFVERAIPYFIDLNVETRTVNGAEAVVVFTDDEEHFEVINPHFIDKESVLAETQRIVSRISLMCRKAVEEEALELATERLRDGEDG